MNRDFSWLDQLCIHFDRALRAITHGAPKTEAPYPAKDQPCATLSDSERRNVAGLMRVNHVGEICAQALYHGQEVASFSPEVKESMKQAAYEEGDHLAWCHERLNELQSHTSWLNPVWYAGSFCLGAVAGVMGDGWSLGFVAETEKQVLDHLEEHLKRLPAQDERSEAILTQMAADEAKHRDEAIRLGAKTLPLPVRWAMKGMSKVMVNTAYWV